MRAAGCAVTTTTAPRPACRRRSAPARCGRGCWRRPSSCWSSAASPARRPRSSPSGPGVSRGAQLHHFPTKNDLVVAAVEHLTAVRGAELAAAAARLPTGAPSYPRGAADARRPLHLAGLHRRPRAVGRRPHRRDPARRRRARSSSGSGARPTALTVELPRRRRGARRHPRAGPGHPRPGARAGPGHHHHRRHPAPRPHPRRVGRRSSTRELQETP